MKNKSAFPYGCVVTGCAGFLGTHLVRNLLLSGIPVVGVDDLSSGSRGAVAEHAKHAHFSLVEQSILTPGLLDEICANHPEIRCVIHLAAVVSVPFSLSYPEETMRINHEGTVGLHEDARRLGLSSFVFAGSASEYGDVETLPVREQDIQVGTGPQSPYGAAKRMTSEHILKSGYGCSLRFFNIYGPGQNPSNPYSGVISRFAGMALSGKRLCIEGDGGQTRDFVHVDDVVRAIRLAAGIDGEPRTGVFNVGTGRPVSILRLAEEVSRITGKGAPFRFLPPREGDIRHSYADVTKFASATGFAPQVALGEGLEATLQWYADNVVPV